MRGLSTETLLVFALTLVVPVLRAQTAPPLDAIKTDAELTRAVTLLDKQLFDVQHLRSRDDEVSGRRESRVLSR